MSAPDPGLRERLDDAIARWEQKGPTSLTVALLAEATYAARDVLASATDVCDQVEANPVGWGGDPAVSLARTFRARLDQKYTCPPVCVETNHPGREHNDWLAAPTRSAD